LCSTYYTNVIWTSWTATTAVGYGTEVETSFQPSCAQGTKTFHPNIRVVLSNPKWEQFCASTNSGRLILFRGAVFTANSMWGTEFSTTEAC